MKLNNLWQRIITGIFFVAVIIGATLYHQYSFFLLLLLINVGSVFEFYRITLNKINYLALAFSFLLFIVPVVTKNKIQFQSLLAILFSILAIIEVFKTNRNWKNIAFTITAWIYITLPLTLFYQSSLVKSQVGFIQLSELQYNPLLAINLFVLIWCSDTYAYVCGRLFGKTPFYPAVSPKKTWEGFIGAIVLTVITAYFMSNSMGINPLKNCLIAVATVVFGSIGDLVESMLKREHNIKDSGQILPGHGGFLDRFDALLISLPMTTLLYQLL